MRLFAAGQADNRVRGCSHLVIAALAIGLFGASWAVLHRGVFTRSPVEDTPVYQQYGDDIVHGKVPYRDFRLEYPPAALAVFALPAIGSPSPETYKQRFEWIMLVCGAATIALMAVALVALRADQRRMAIALGLAGISPLLLGPVILTRFDLWPTMLTVAALAAVLAGGLRIGSGVLGLAFAAKLYPALLLPLVLAYVWKRLGRREALVCGCAFVAIAAACFVPFAILSPGGLWHSIFNQGNRPLQIESLGAGILLALHHVFGLGVTMVSSHGSQNLAGRAPDALAALQTVVQVVAVVAIWVWYGRGEAGRERLVRASAATVVAFIALGKVLSPQFLIWLIPLVPLVRGRRGLAASGLLAGAFALTQAWFPYRYWELPLQFDTADSWLVLIRDLVLVGLLAALVWSRRAVRRPA